MIQSSSSVRRVLFPSAIDFSFLLQTDEEEEDEEKNSR